MSVPTRADFIPILDCLINDLRQFDARTYPKDTVGVAALRAFSRLTSVLVRPLQIFARSSKLIKD